MLLWEACEMQAMKGMGLAMEQGCQVRKGSLFISHLGNCLVPFGASSFLVANLLFLLLRLEDGISKQTTLEFTQHHCQPPEEKLTSLSPFQFKNSRVGLPWWRSG